MADFVFNVSKGAAAEKVRDDPTKLGALILKTADSDSAMKRRATVAAILTASTEANFTNYARKTGVIGTVTVDNTNDRVDVDMPDQTWSSAGGATNNTTAKLVVFYDEGGTDTTRIPLVGLDFVATTTGVDLVWQLATAGFYRAS
jgi:hypothetical protein